MLDKHEAVLSGHKVTVKEIMRYDFFELIPQCWGYNFYDFLRSHAKSPNREVIARKQRIAGQSIPPEKLAEKRYKRFIEHEKDIIFPAFVSCRSLWLFFLTYSTRKVFLL